MKFRAAAFIGKRGGHVKIFEGTCHPNALRKAHNAGYVVDLEDASADGFVTVTGVYLTRAEVFKRTGEARSERMALSA